MLSKQKNTEMMFFISGLKGRGRLNFCEKCHRLYTCGNNHCYLLHEDGVSSVCGYHGKVVNCAISNKVVREGISQLDYWRDGKKLS